MMKLKQSLFKVLALSVCVAPLGSAHAQQENDPSPLQVKGRVWAQYNYDLTAESDHKNGFDLYRTYLQADYKFNSDWSATLLLDAARTGAPANYLSNYVRNAYVQQNGVIGEGSQFRFGLQPTAFTSAVDGSTKTRWLGKSLADQAGLVPTQDAGASMAGKADAFAYGVAVRNGSEGLTQPGNNNDVLSYDVWVGLKDIAGTGLGVVVYDSLQPQSLVGTKESKSNTLALALTSNNSILDGAFEVVLLNQDDETLTGYGATVNVKTSEDLAVYGRFFTGDEEFQTSKLKAKSILTVGPNYAFISGKVSTALLFESAASTLEGASASNKILWNWAANF